MLVTPISGFFVPPVEAPGIGPIVGCSEGRAVQRLALPGDAYPVLRWSMARLRCDACGVAVPASDSYQEAADAARRLGWTIGEESVLCALCGEAARVPKP